MPKGEGAVSLLLGVYDVDTGNIMAASPYFEFMARWIVDMWTQRRDRKAEV